jgi:NAD-dependent dihydropyrimidine dehydrogenase PreA subunit
MGLMFPHTTCKKVKGVPRSEMAYVINEPCIGTKDNSCVEVCPVGMHPPDT